MLVVYTLAMCAPAFMSLTCECTAEHRLLHACCLDHEAEQRCQSGQCCEPELHGADRAIESPCHCDRHAISTQLYTASSEERHVRLVIFDLLPQIGCECCNEAFMPVRHYSYRQTPVSHIAGGHVGSRGLRAPPVSA